MPNPNNRTGRDFSMYDAMDDEQLRQILRDDASKIESGLDGSSQPSAGSGI